MRFSSGCRSVQSFAPSHPRSSGPPETRMISFKLSLLAIFLGFASHVHGLKIPFERYPRALRSKGGFRTTSKLTYAFSAAPVDGADTVDNKMDIRYATNITINGKAVVVALDTGSTDLWVNPPGGIGQFNNTGIPLELKYGDGSYGVSGTIGVSPFRFGSYEVPQQAFLDVTTSTIANLNSLEIYGTMGLSFDFATSSEINGAVKGQYGSSATWGQSVLHNIFDQHPQEPNLVGISLSRTDDLEDTQGGSFTIGEINPTYSAVSNSPQLPQFPDGGDRWTTLLEGVFVDGHSIPVTTSFSNVSAGHGVALLDTGDPTAMFPTAVWNGIYSSIPGSVKYEDPTDPSGPAWIIPCNTTAILEIVFGGQKFPIHPLDLSTISKPVTVGAVSAVACVSAFRASDDFAKIGFEYSLGDSFLRNVYSVYHFGDSTSHGKPYIQLLSRIDPQKAVSQVATIRAKTMASLPAELLPAAFVKLISGDSSGGGGASTSSAGGNKLAVDGSSAFPIGYIDGETVKKYGLTVIGLLAINVIIGLVLIVFAVLSCVRRGSDKKRGRGMVPGSASTHYVAVGVDDDAYPGHQKRYGD